MLLALLTPVAAHTQETQITIPIDQPGPAISPYIYGQFIEHLGRCIHDGVWAEKLRDRKFLLAPTNSPWSTLNNAGVALDVFHDTAGAYAGDHCLAVWLREASSSPAGIRQGQIGLIKGKEYVGYAILAKATDGPAPVEIRLAWGESSDAGQSIRLDHVGREYRRFPFRFRAGATTDSASLSVLLSAPAHLWLASLSLMPADNVHGMRPDTLALIRRLNPPITRWPGGNFVSGYHWKDAIGERDRRPARWERAWNDVEDNDFGFDEFMTFCAEVSTEPYLAVNTGLGSADEAADEVEYATGSTRTRWGAERARNGHTRPYAVKWWGVGNEMYGSWQLGNVSVERYAIRHDAFVSAMKGRQPSIQIIAVGAPGAWNDVMLPRCAPSMDLLSGHHYTERKFHVPFSADDAAAFERNFPAYSDNVAAGVRRLVTDFRQRQHQGNAAIDRVRLAVDEWGIVRDWNPAPDRPGIGSFEHYYTLGDAIATGRALHELLRSADVVAMANWAQTVNVIGAIKTSRNFACLDPAGHLLALYRAQVGGVYLPLTVSGPGTVDAIATWDKTSGALALGLINYSPTTDATVMTHLPRPARTASARAWRITGPGLGATNIPGQPETVTTTLVPEGFAFDRPFRLPPHSITVVRFEKVSPR